MVSSEARNREGRSDLRIIYLMLRAVRRRRALVFVANGASQGWTASLLSLPVLEHHLVSLGVFVDVDRQESQTKVTKVSLHAHVFDSMFVFQPVRFELVSRDCQPSLQLISLLSLTHSLSLLFLPHNTSYMHTDNLHGGNLKPCCWKTV